MSSSPAPLTESAAAILPKVRSAVLWRSGSQIAGQLVMWGSTLLVLRLLNPSDYGLFAMTQVVVSLAQLMNGYSFAASLVQADELDRERTGQVFGALILMNGAMALAQFLLAPVAAAYFRQPMVTDMLRVQCLLHLLTPFLIMPQALLAREIDFRTQARANLGAAFAGAVAAPSLALAGFGVWTLVLAPIAAFATRAVLLGLIGRWWVRPRFHLAGAGATLGFGGTMLASDLLWFIQTQADVFIAGRRFDAHLLGLYSEGLFLTQLLVNKFVPALNDIAFPAYARMQREPGAVAWSFARAAAIIMAAALPFSVGLAATAGPLVVAVMGPRWVAAVPLIRLLALAMPFVTLHILYAPATNALGRPGIAARTSGAGAILLPIAFLIGVRFGPLGMAGAWLIASPLLLIVSSALSLPAIGLRPADLARALAPPLLPALAMGLLVWAAGQAVATLPAAEQLLMLVPLGVALYALFLWLGARPLVLQAIAMVRGRGAQVPAI